MAEDPDKTLKDRLGAALGELTDTLTTAQQIAFDAERGLAQAQLETDAAQPAASPPVITADPS